MRLVLRNGHDTDTTFHNFTLNNKSDYLARSRHVALVDINARVVLPVLAANMTNVVGHEQRSVITRVGRRVCALRLDRKVRFLFMICVTAGYREPVFFKVQ
jgi:hypothetical protein